MRGRSNRREEENDHLKSPWGACNGKSYIIGGNLGENGELTVVCKTDTHTLSQEDRGKREEASQAVESMTKHMPSRKSLVKKTISLYQRSEAAAKGGRDIREGFLFDQCQRKRVSRFTSGSEGSRHSWGGFGFICS